MNAGLVGKLAALLGVPESTGIGEKGRTAGGVGIALLAQRALDIMDADAESGRELLTACCDVLNDLVLALCSESATPALRESMAIALFHVSGEKLGNVSLSKSRVIEIAGTCVA